LIAEEGGGGGGGGGDVDVGGWGGLERDKGRMVMVISYFLIYCRSPAVVSLDHHRGQ
jgi:hypothetical protein